VLAGYPAVAKLSAQNLEKLKLPSHVKRVILAGDNDDAGQAGVKKAAKAFSERGLTVAIAALPEGVKDLNDVLRAQGAEAVCRLLAEAAPWKPATEQPENEGAAKNATKEDEADPLIEFADDVELPLKAQYLIKTLLGRGDFGVMGRQVAVRASSPCILPAALPWAVPLLLAERELRRCFTLVSKGRPACAAGCQA
jgi:DNA primase